MREQLKAIDVRLRVFRREVEKDGILREFRKREFARSRGELRRFKDHLAERRRAKHASKVSWAKEGKRLLRDSVKPGIDKRG